MPNVFSFRPTDKIQRKLDNLPRNAKADWINAACEEKRKRETTAIEFAREMLIEEMRHKRAATRCRQRRVDLVKNKFLTQEQLDALEKDEDEKILNSCVKESIFEEFNFSP